MSNSKKHLDLIILGGGPAGMAAALVAGRGRLRTLVLNGENPRSAVTKETHGFYTRDGAHPLELLATGKEQLKKYTSVTYTKGMAVQVDHRDELFFVHSDGGQRWAAKRLLVATGYKDELKGLAMPGIEAVYGKSVFPCPFCDGFELSAKRLAVFIWDKTPEILEHYLAMIGTLSSKDRIVFTNGHHYDEGLHRVLTDRNIEIQEGKVLELLSQDGLLQAVKLESGKVIKRDAGFVGAHYSTPTTAFASKLGVETSENPFGWTIVEADAGGLTGVKNLYVAGDMRSTFGGITNAVSQGATCGSTIVREIAMERWHLSH